MVLDTHALVWWLAEPRKLSPKAKRAIQSAVSSSGIVISAASILEISTLVRRGRLQLTLSIDEWLKALHSLPELRIEPINAEIAARAGSFDATVQGDPIDRLIIATAVVMGSPLVSADAQMQSFPWVRTIW